MYSCALCVRLYRCPKHVEIFMIINHNCCIKLVPLIIFIYDARSHIHQIHTYIPWIHKCVIKAAGCGTSHKYIYTILHCKILQTFYKNKSSVYINKFTYRLKGVCMYVFSYGCFKFCLVILEDCHTRWYTVENFYASTDCTYLKT